MSVVSSLETLLSFVWSWGFVLGEAASGEVLLSESESRDSES